MARTGHKTQRKFDCPIPGSLPPVRFESTERITVYVQGDDVEARLVFAEILYTGLTHRGMPKEVIDRCRAISRITTTTVGQLRSVMERPWDRAQPTYSRKDWADDHEIRVALVGETDSRSPLTPYSQLIIVD